jgi:hypothetical protein
LADQLVSTLRLAVVRRGLFGGGIEVSEQVTGSDDVDDVVLKDVAEPMRDENKSSAERMAQSVISRRTAVWREQAIAKPLSGLGR